MISCKVNTNREFLGRALAKLVSVFLGLALYCSSAIAVDIEVVEGQPDSVGAVEQQPSSDYRAPATVYNNADVSYELDDRPVDTQTELLLQLQVLQTEVMNLRGMVEEQAHHIEQLQQRRLDDYVDLDRRISELAGSATRPTGDNPTATSQPAAPAAASPSSKPSTNVISNKPAVSKPVTAVDGSSVTTIKVGDNSEADEKGRAAYKAAYEKVKDRQFDDAKIAMVAFVGDYPEHRYVPNAYFWLGELHYHDSNLNQSRDAFNVLVESYPDHRKVPDAKFKLAKVFHQLGEPKKAKVLLESVINDHASSRVAKPARDYLDNSIK